MIGFRLHDGDSNSERLIAISCASFWNRLLVLCSLLSSAFRRLYDRFLRNGGIHLPSYTASRASRRVWHRREGLTSHITHGFYGFLLTLQENCQLISYRQYGHNRFLSGTFFAWFQASATRYEIFVAQRVIVVNYRHFGMTIGPLLKESTIPRRKHSSDHSATGLCTCVV